MLRPRLLAVAGLTLGVLAGSWTVLAPAAQEPATPEAKSQTIPTPTKERPPKPLEITTWNVRAAFLTLLDRRKSEFASLCQQRPDNQRSWTIRLCEGLRYAADKREITWKVAVRPDQATVDERLFTNFVRDDILNLLRVPRAQAESVKITVVVTRVEAASPDASDMGLTEEVSRAPPPIARIRPPSIKTRSSGAASQARKSARQEAVPQPAAAPRDPTSPETPPSAPQPPP